LTHLITQKTRERGAWTAKVGGLCTEVWVSKNPKAETFWGVRGASKRPGSSMNCQKAPKRFRRVDGRKKKKEALGGTEKTETEKLYRSDKLRKTGRRFNEILILKREGGIFDKTERGTGGAKEAQTNKLDAVREGLKSKANKLDYQIIQRCGSRERGGEKKTSRKESP